MMGTMKRAAVAVLTSLAGAGCGAHSTDVRVADKPLPSAFEAASSGPSIGNVSWRAYFADEQLNQLIGSALRANPDLQMALQRIEMARAVVRQRSGALLPQVSGVAGAGVQKVGRYTTEGAGNATTEITPGRAVPTHVTDLSLGFESSWEVDLWGKLRSQRDASLARYLASIEGRNLVVTGLVADIATAYFDLLALDQTLDVLTQTAIRQKEALDVVRVQKEAGRANELAVQQFEAQLLTTRALEAQTLNDTQQLENLINLLRGSYPQPVPRSKPALLKEVATTIATGVPSGLLRSRPDIREAELQVQAAKCDLRAARAAFFPSLNISAGVGYQAFNPKYLFYTPESLVYSASAGLIAPLVNRSGIEADFSAAKAAQIEAMYNYQKVVLSAFVEVQNGLSRLASSAAIVALKKAQKQAVQQTVEIADTLYRAGKATYFEVLIAQQNTLSAELELVEAIKDRHRASIATYKALGGGWR